MVSLKTTYKKEVEYKNIVKDVVLYVASTTVEVDETTDTAIGFATLDAIMNSKADGVIPKLYRKDGNIQDFLNLVSKELLSKFASGEIDFLKLYKVSSMYDLEAITSKENFMDEYAIVLMRNYSHDILDLDGVPYPHAIKLDYIEGSLSDEYYDLDRLFTYLSSDTNRFSEVSRKPIPYYNRSESQTEQIEVTFIPTKEEYAKIFAAGDYFEKRKMTVAISGIDKFKVSDF